MNLLITGAAGHLGKHLVTALGREHNIHAVDVVPRDGHGSGTTHVADLSSEGACRNLLQRVGPLDAVLHCASIHPWKSYSDDQYLDANIKGTWHLYAALREAGIQKVLLTSSIAVNGYAAPASDWPVTEDREYPVGDIYSYTKRAQEDTARFFARQNIRTIALRPPAFMPKPPRETGLALLTPFAVVEDIVAAHVAGLGVLLGGRTAPRPLENFEAFFVTNRLPYDATDAAKFMKSGSLEPLVARHYPWALEWFRSEGSPGGLGAVYSLHKARHLLGWEPAFNFEHWWASRPEGNEEVGSP